MMGFPKQNQLMTKSWTSSKQLCPSLGKKKCAIRGLIVQSKDRPNSSVSVKSSSPWTPKPEQGKGQHHRNVIYD
eukprot:3705908-Ditylum_brightwellii.AAC.2